MNYQEAVDWLYGTQLHGVKLGLQHTFRLCEALGIETDGREKPRILHVAGTNGKGSVCAMLDAISRASGRRTGLFTSPHLVTFRERIRLNGEPISEHDVARGLTKIRRITEGWEHSPTFFEITTALALSYFQSRHVDVIVLETGMGGRLDATNVVTPAVSVLTPIDIDHQQWLGNEISTIASEKAGIIKPGVPVVSAPQQGEVQCVLSHLAHERDCAYHLVCSPIKGVQINLAGSHQRWNAALAVHALHIAGLAPSDLAIAQGLGFVQWPGRFHQIPERRVVLDGAHNPAAARQLALTWQEVNGHSRSTLIIGILNDKDVQAVCAELVPIAARVLAVPVNSPRSSTPEEVKQLLQLIAPQLECRLAPSLAAALEEAALYPEPMLVTGSLFLVGEALTLLTEQPKLETSSQ